MSNSRLAFVCLVIAGCDAPSAPDAHIATDAASDVGQDAASTDARISMDAPDASLTDALSSDAALDAFAAPDAPEGDAGVDAMAFVDSPAPIDARVSIDALAPLDARVAPDARVALDARAAMDAPDTFTVDASRDAFARDAFAVDASCSAYSDVRVIFDARLQADARVDASTGPWVDAGVPSFLVTYQTGAMPTNVTAERGSPTALTVLAAPWAMASRYALRARVQVGDDAGSGYPRSEVTPRLGGLRFGTRYLIRSGFYFPTGSVFPMAHAGMIRGPELVGPFQMHGRDGEEPVFTTALVNGNLVLRFQPDEAPASMIEIPYGPVPTGRYVPFEIEYQPASRVEHGGYIRISIDGRRMLDHTGINQTGLRACNADGGFFKMGLYDYWSNVNPLLDVYLDDINIYTL